MGMWCQPGQMPDGRKTAWGTISNEDLFGPQGWCTAEKPKIQCECYIDGELLVVGVLLCATGGVDLGSGLFAWCSSGAKCLAGRLFLRPMLQSICDAFMFLVRL